MSIQRKDHRSFVSYIDKSREYYAAQGYRIPYGWAHYQNTPFSPLARPISESKVGIVTTAFFHPGTEPEGVPTSPPKQPYAAPSDPIPESLNTDDVSWDKEATNMDDLGSYLPLKTSVSKISEKKVGSVSKRFYGIPTDYSQRRTLEDANQILNWCREDDVDALLLVPG